MITTAKVALAAALLAGTGLAMPTAAPAQEAAQQLKFTPDMLKSAAPAKTALDARDTATAEPLVVQSEAAAKTDDDKYLAASLRLVLEAQKIEAARTAGRPGDETRLAAPLDALLANPKTPAANKPGYAFQRGVISAKSKQFAQAVTYFERARQLGSTDPQLPFQIVYAKVNAGDVNGGMTELQAVVTRTEQAGGKADEQLYRFALSRTVATKDNAATLSWIRRYLLAYPTAKNWRDMIKIYGLQQGSLITPSRTQALDLYRLMRATKSLAGQYDYEDYAAKANQTGLPYETKTVLAEGRAAGKIPAGSGNATTLIATANKSIANEGSLASIETRAKASGTGVLAAQTGDAYLGSGSYAKAAELYRVALQKGGAATNDVNTRLGIALTMTGDKAGAKAAFAAVQGAPSADIAALWSIYLDAPAPVA